MLAAEATGLLAGRLCKFLLHLRDVSLFFLKNDGVFATALAE